MSLARRTSDPSALDVDARTSAVTSVVDDRASAAGASASAASAAATPAEQRAQLEKSTTGRLPLCLLLDLEELPDGEAERAGEHDAGNVWIALLYVSTESL